MRSRTAAQAGFTLVEMLVVIAITGLLMAGLSQAVRYGLAVWTTQASAAARYEDLEATDRVFRQLLGHVEPVKPMDRAALHGDAHRFRFVSVVPGIAALGTSRAEVTVFVNARHELVLRWRAWPAEVADSARAIDTVLLSGIDRIEFRYWGSAAVNDGSAGWRATWDSIAPPRLVRIHLAFPADDGRRWPDIVAARVLG